MEQSKYWTKWLLTRVVETNYYGLYRNSQFEYCQRLLHFVLSCFSFHGKEFRGVFSSSEGLEGNSESLLLFLFHGVKFQVVISSAEGFGREFREFAFIFVPRKGSERNSENFLFLGTAEIPSEITICSIYFVFRGIIFLSEILNPMLYRLVRLGLLSC